MAPSITSLLVTWKAAAVSRSFSCITFHFVPISQLYECSGFAPAMAPGLSFSTLFATHPPLDRRLEQLAQLEAQLGRPA